MQCVGYNPTTLLGPSNTTIPDNQSNRRIYEGPEADFVTGSLSRLTFKLCLAKRPRLLLCIHFSRPASAIFGLLTLKIRATGSEYQSHAGQTTRELGNDVQNKLWQYQVELISASGGHTI